MISSTLLIALTLLPTLADPEVVSFDHGRPRSAGGGVTDYIDATYNTFAWYPMESGAGVCDDGFSTNDLTESGGAGWVHDTSDFKEGAASADTNDVDTEGCTGTTTVAAAPWNLDQDWAFGAWLYPNKDETNARNFLLFGGRTEVRDPGNAPTATFRVRIDATNWNVGTFTAAAWNHLIISYDTDGNGGAGTWTQYINGGTATPTGGGSACTGQVNTNNSGHTADADDTVRIADVSAWDMKIDDLAIFTQEISAADACKVYQQGCWGEGGTCP